MIAKEMAEAVIKDTARAAYRDAPVSDDGKWVVQKARFLAWLLEGDFNRGYFYDVVDLIETLDDYRDGNLDFDLVFGQPATAMQRELFINGLEEDLRLAVNSLIDSLENGY